ncbi:MAG: hypothetical protein IT532_19055 [Burkholderiales bacterium]|nr:hypothetical protein [Burkholderiales bacterium]
MLDQWLAALEATQFARALGNSMLVYPLVNAGHIFGVALLVGSIVPLDLRLLSAWRSQPLAPLWHVLTRTAAVGLVLAILFGFLLFATRATEYAASPLFLAKMAIVAAATANALVLRVAFPRAVPDGRVNGAAPRPVCAAAAFSIIAWLAVLTLGRLVGYF